MVDSYIDPYEAQGYGHYARDRMAAVCLGRILALDGMIRFAMEAQERADADLAIVLRRHPPLAPATQRAAVMAEARDLIVDFGAYLDSLKGRPLDPRRVFQTDALADLPRRRLPRLIAHVERILAEIRGAGLAIRDRTWLRGFTAVHRKLTALEARRRPARRVEDELPPDLRLAYDRWLAVYRANQQLLRGFLAHLGQPELLPLLFDDLAAADRAAPPPSSSSIPPGPPSVVA